MISSNRIITEGNDTIKILAPECGWQPISGGDKPTLVQIFECVFAKFPHHKIVTENADLNQAIAFFQVDGQNITDYGECIKRARQADVIAMAETNLFVFAYAMYYTIVDCFQFVKDWKYTMEKYKNLFGEHSVAFSYFHISLKRIAKLSNYDSAVLNIFTYNTDITRAGNCLYYFHTVIDDIDKYNPQWIYENYQTLKITAKYAPNAFSLYPIQKEIDTKVRNYVRGIISHYDETPRRNEPLVSYVMNDMPQDMAWCVLTWAEKLMRDDLDSHQGFA
jgi:hypothetical protein